MDRFCSMLRSSPLAVHNNGLVDLSLGICGLPRIIISGYRVGITLLPVKIANIPISPHIFDMDIQGVIFDLDGTLVDSREADLRALSKAVREIMGEEIPLETLDRFFGISSRETAEQISAAEADRLIARWVVHYQQEAAEGLHMFPGVEPALRELHASGLQLGVVTLQTRSEMNFTRQCVQLDHLICSWVAMDDTTHPKPHPEPLFLVLEQLGLEAGQSVMIGDSIKDMNAGRAAGCRTGAALWGSLERDDILAFRPDYIFSHPAEMRQLCDHRTKV